MAANPMIGSIEYPITEQVFQKSSSVVLSRFSNEYIPKQPNTENP